jgi:hypothetical protein
MADASDVESVDARVYLAARPAPAVNVSVQAGAARYESPADAIWTTSMVQARVRATAAGHGPSIDLRAERAPLAVSPLLVASRVVRSEARATLEVPLAAMRMRGIGRLAHFDAAGEPSNARSGVEAALVLPLGGGRVQPAVHYRAIGFQRPSTAGYFAPRLAESLEAGLSLDSGDEDRLSVVADVGAGVQRVAEHGGVTGHWTRAFRLWGQATLSLGPSRAWLVEVEAYDAPFALERATTAGQWRYLSLTSGLRWALR